MTGHGCYNGWIERGSPQNSSFTRSPCPVCRPVPPDYGKHYGWEALGGFAILAVLGIALCACFVNVVT